uniref:Uncharacterized protein n=1 Tax=Oxytricha trifallax TaxID=1172189 RepID=G9HRC4_9SPIT|nr:hypothetical protein [Oxytricha trifallax]
MFNAFIIKNSILFLLFVHFIDYIFKLKLNLFPKYVYDSHNKILSIFFIIVIVYYNNYSALLLYVYVLIYFIYFLSYITLIDLALLLNIDVNLYVDLKKYNKLYLSNYEILKLYLSYPKLLVFSTLYVVLRNKSLNYKSFLVLLYQRSLGIPIFYIKLSFFLADVCTNALKTSDLKKKLYVSIPFIIIYEIWYDSTFVVNKWVCENIKEVEGKKITIINRNIMLNNKDINALIKILDYLHTKEMACVSTSLKGMEHHTQAFKQNFTEKGASLVEIFTKSKLITYKDNNFKNNTFKTSNDNILNWREYKNEIHPQYLIQSFVDNQIITDRKYLPFWKNRPDDFFYARWSLTYTAYTMITYTANIYREPDKQVLIQNGIETRCVSFVDLKKNKEISETAIQYIEHDLFYDIENIKKILQEIYDCPFDNEQSVNKITELYSLFNKMDLKDKHNILAEMMIKTGRWNDKKELTDLEEKYPHMQ